MRRFAAQGRRGLASRSHAPKSCPDRTSGRLEARIVRLRTQTGFGAKRLKAEFEFPVSEGAIARILRQRSLVRPPKRKHVTKQDLRAVKAQWPVFSQLCHDTKDLDDIPHYWPQAKTLGVPLIQYTAREVRTGLTFAGYAQERSAALAGLFAQRVMDHLAASGVPLEEVGFQSDNGSEYTGGRDRRRPPHGFKPTVEARGLSHTFIPPAAHTYNSDVETVHRLCEDEFFDRECFRSRPHFLAKVGAYWRYFNVARKNGYKGNRSPLDLLRQLTPQIDPRITLWQPAFLDPLQSTLLPEDIQRRRAKEGKYLPAYP